jgi:hypothetical protein
MWSSWVKEKGRTQAMYITKLKDGPKRVKKIFSMIWKRFSKWYDGGGENGIIRKELLELKYFLLSKY